MNYLIWRQQEKIFRSALFKVVQLAQKKELGDRVILTGGLSHSIYFTGILSDKLDQKVESEEFGRFAGAYGAALLAREKKDKRR